jgi:hypothetical protein
MHTYIHIYKYRVKLREAVLDAMRTGDLAVLLRTAKQQHKKYHRANLEDVMKEVLEEEHSQVCVCMYVCVCKYVCICVCMYSIQPNSSARNTIAQILRM